MNADEIRAELERLLFDLERPMPRADTHALLSEYARRMGYVREKLRELVSE